MKLILLRGPSGTGKSTIARHIADQYNERFDVLYHIEAAHFEADQFFVGYNKGSKYRFDATKLAAAHTWCQSLTERSMLHEVPIVIVSNTFIKQWEMKRYLELANEYHYEIELIRTPGPWDADTLFKRNKHNVPMASINRHIESYQPHEDEQVWSNMNIFK